MKSYSIITAAVLFAANCLGPNLRVCTAQQPATGAKPCQNGCTGQSQISPGAATAARPAAGTSVSAKSPAEKPSFHILAEFTESLNAKKLKPGDKVKAQVTQDVLSHGKIVIPVESKLVGHVTEVKAHRADDPESRLGIVFDKVLLPHHRELDFQGVLQALAPPAPRRSRVDEPDQMLPPAVMGVSQAPGMAPMGSTGGRGGSNAAVPAKNMSISTMPAGVPVYMDGTPGSNAGNSAGADLDHSGTVRAGGDAKPMSVGMPLGVFGLKGLSLTPGASNSTPGPVIRSNASNVKLENGTQVLLKVTDAAVPQP